ncbi:MAG: hypothetical protein VX899_11465 [Myxococcota bacterium]|nr:hypothetical protein [Myxococcota bacterium]
MHLGLLLLTAAWGQETPPPGEPAPAEQRAPKRQSDIQAEAQRGAADAAIDARLDTPMLRPMVLGAGAGACLGLSGCITPCVGPACLLPTAVLAPPAVAFARQPSVDAQRLEELELQQGPDYMVGYEVAYNLQVRKRRGLYAGVGALAGTTAGALIGTAIYIAVVGITPWENLTTLPEL